MSLKCLQTFRSSHLLYLTIHKNFCIVLLNLPSSPRHSKNPHLTMQTSLPNVLKYLHKNYSGLLILRMSTFISCYLTFSCATTETEHHTHLI